LAENEQLNRVLVRIFGEDYTIKSPSDSEYIEKVAQKVDKRMKEIARVKPRLSLHQIAVLAALNLADEYLKLEEEYYSLMEEIETEGYTKKDTKYTK